MVDNTELQELLQGLMAEYDALLQQREIVRQQEDALKNQGSELDRKLAGLKQTLEGLSLYSTAKNEPPEVTRRIVGLAEMAESISKATSFMELGKSRMAAKTLTECCRDILLRTGEWMSALGVRQSLHAAGFDFSEYKSNPLSSIHTTLKRIAESGQAWQHDSNNETLYRWKKDGESVAPLTEIATKKIVEKIVAARKKSK